MKVTYIVGNLILNQGSVISLENSNINTITIDGCDGTLELGLVEDGQTLTLRSEYGCFHGNFSTVRFSNSAWSTCETFTITQTQVDPFSFVLTAALEDDHCTFAKCNAIFLFH